MNTWRRVHATLTFVWALTLIPTLIWWRNSVLWVALMSVYGCFIGHLSAWQATRAEDAAS